MRAPAPDGLTARDTSRYWHALEDLEACAEEQRFEGVRSFYAWERLNTLIGRLKHCFDAYELEGDVGPVRREITAFLDDLAGLSVRPDARLLGQLDRLLSTIEAVLPVVEIVTHAQPSLARVLPSGEFLAVAPDTLARLLRTRAAGETSSPGA